MNWWNWNSNDFHDADNIWTFDHNLMVGPFAAYALVISFSILIAILFSVLSTRIRKLPTTEIIISLSLIMPFSLMGASIFGKLAYENKFIDLIAFWEPGLAIHGGILFAAIGSIPIAWYVTNKYKISIWSYLDAILPHILIAQAIGRWGNFFNHELFGPPMSGPLGIDDIESLSNFWKNMVSSSGGSYYVMHPFFLYESIGLTIAWLIILSAPYFVSIFSGPNKKYKSEFTISAKDTFKSFFIWNKEWPNSYQGVWNRGFIDKINSSERQTYEDNLSSYKNRWAKGNALYKANNPEGYVVLHSGFKTGMYLFFWNLVRAILEIFKAENSMFIKYNKPLSVGLIILMALAGIFIIIFCQFIAPKILRKPEYKYEKQYFYLSK